jgi:hypothetical protein
MYYSLSLFFTITLFFSQESQWIHLKIEQYKKIAKIKTVYSGSSINYFQKKSTKKLNGRLVYEVINTDGISIYKSEIDCYCHIRFEDIENSQSEIVRVTETKKISYGISIPNRPGIDKIFLYHYSENKLILLLESKIEHSRTKLKIDQFDIIKMIDNGKPDNLINFVFLAEGYQKNEMDKFASDVQKAIDSLFTTAPFDMYKNYFNVYRINVESKESGSTHPATAQNDPAPAYSNETYFKSTYDGGVGKVHRLLIIQDEFNAELILNTHTPFWNQAFILVNDEMYGGSGGRHAVSSVNRDMANILIHEIGHSFAYLSDEYDYGTGSGFESTNTTLLSDRNNIKWSPWIKSSTPIPTPLTDTYENLVGLFEGAAYTPTGCYRPQLNCMMRIIYYEFCVVCKEQLVSSIYMKLKPNFLISPSNTNVISYGEALDFSIVEESGIQLVNSLLPKWYLNDKLIHTGFNLQIQPYDYLPHDQIRLKCILTDHTDLVRIPEKKKSLELIKKEWLIQKKKNNHLISFYPENKNLVLSKGKKLLFKVNIVNRTEDIYQEWFIDNKFLGSLDSMNFNSSDLKIGQYVMTYRLFNSQGERESEVNWNIDLQNPSLIQLEQNYPNPFNPSTTIRFQLSDRSKVSLIVLNSLGQTIRTLLISDLDPGIKEIIWDGKNNKNEYVSSGIYFYKLKTEGKSITKKMVLLK